MRGWNVISTFSVPEALIGVEDRLIRLQREPAGCGPVYRCPPVWPGATGCGSVAFALFAVGICYYR